MKIKYFPVLVAIAMFLSGCAGFWNPLPTTTTTTTTTTTSSSGVFYVLNQGTNQIVAYQISSGTLEEVTAGTGAPNPTSFTGTANCMAIAPGGGFLYLGTTSGIYAYQIQSGGSLLPLYGGGTISSDKPLAMQVAYDGVTGNTWLIDAFPVSTSGSNTQVTVDAIPLNSTGIYNGSDTVPSQNVTAADSTVYQLALTPGAVASSPNTGYVLLAMGNGGAAAIPFNGASSTPFSTPQTLINPISTQAVLSVAVDPQERLFYIGQTDAVSGSGGLLVYSYSALGSGPDPAPASSLASGGPSPYFILPESTGNYVYVANANSSSNGAINWFDITASGTSYSVAAGSTVQAGIMLRGLAEDSSDQFILAVSFGVNTGAGGDPDLEAFTMSSGALSSVIASSTGNSGSDPVGALAVAARP